MAESDVDTKGMCPNGRPMVARAVKANGQTCICGVVLLLDRCSGAESIEARSICLHAWPSFTYHFAAFRHYWHGLSLQLRCGAELKLSPGRGHWGIFRCFITPTVSVSMRI